MLINATWRVTHAGVVLLDWTDFSAGEPRIERAFIADRVAILGGDAVTYLGRKNVSHTASFTRVIYFQNDDEARTFERNHTVLLSAAPADCTIRWLNTGLSDTLQNAVITGYRPRVENNFFFADYTLQGGLLVHNTEEVSTMVMLADATSAAAYVTKDFGADQSEVWISFGLGFPATALAFWAGDGSGDFATVLSGSDAILGAIVEVAESGPVYNWYLYGGSSSDEDPGPPVPAPGVWQDCELHLLQGGTTLVEFYVESVLLASFTDPETFPIRKFSVGQRGTDTNGPDARAYIKNVKAGTTRGASDLFADNFDSGDLSNWDSTAGTCSVIGNPYG